MHEAIKSTCGFYVAVNNPAMRKMCAKGNDCLYLMGNERMEDVLVIRDEGAVTPGGKEKCPYPVPSGYEVIIKRMQYLSGLY